MTVHGTYPCPQCQIGHLQPGKLAYVRVHHGMIISLPDMPASTCDVCDYYEYEPATLLRIDSLLGRTKMDEPKRSGGKHQAVDTTESNSGQSLKP